MDQVPLGQTFGAMLIGAFIAMAIYGITTLQTYYYYSYYPNDGLEFRLLVAIIWSLDTLHVIFMCHSVYYYLITGFGNPLLLADGIWSLFASIAVNVLMAFLSQCFFTRRIFKLSSERIRWWLSGIIGLCVFAHFFFGIETVVYFFIKKQFTRLPEVVGIAVLPFAIFAILSDILIAATLCFLLASKRSDFEDTNNILNKLIVYAINRCILTSAVAVIEVVVFVTLPHSLFSFPFDFVIGKLYANSLLATLNSRIPLGGKGRDGSSNTTDTALSFNLASVNTNRAVTSLVRVPSRENGSTEGRRRIGTMSEDSPETLADSTGMKKSNHSYYSVT